jgi:hypothetical protein
MKRKLVVASALCVFLLFISTLWIFNRNEDVYWEEQVEEGYYGLFVTMLHPYVDEAINNYYKEYMTSLPQAPPYVYKFTKVEKTPGLNYSYTVEMEVTPYVGPHLTVGHDAITFKVELGRVTVEEFKHIGSYELPSNYQNSIKKKLPGPYLNY